MTAEVAAAMPAPAGGIRLRRASSHYLPTLDGWRAVAIGVVLLAHSAASIGVAWPHVPVPLMERSGLFGVEIFFALSGFLITTWLIREEQTFGRISLSAFYTRRVFRILPAALALLLTVAILSVRGVFPVTVGRWLSSLLFVANISHATGSWYVGHFWSLAVEEHFYLFWPVIFLLLRKNRRRFAFTVFTGLAVALWRAIDFKYHLTISNFDIWWGRTDINADSLSWGVCVALVYADAEWRQKLLRFLRRSFVPIGLAAIVIACEWLPLPDWKLSMAALTVKAVAIPLLIVWTLTNTRSWPARLLETAPLRFIGLISYSLYLWQQLFCVETVSWVPGQHVLQSFPANIFCAIGCATLSYTVIERPFIARGRLFTARLGRGKSAPITAGESAPERA